MTTFVAEPNSAKSLVGVQEAVLISGPLKGEIVQIKSDETKFQEQITPEVADLLEQFAVAMSELSQEVQEILLVSRRITRRLEALENHESS